ncbi:MAG: site-2 protease family protein [Planctomycetaceae bacterium]|nr:site-2 protease family protein [Planctomycetaceae bacterium]
MAILALDIASLTDSLVNILTVAIGLGLVIFFHELGHFAVAKWCDVLVERFSIGFGPILWRKKWGETEYALSLIPFGGYVKMLGQDDMDPSQLSSEEIAENPRSYTAKNVAQRMGIISAGVIMNVITGLLFFMFAFRSGVDTTPAVVGDLQVGMPAWNAGMRSGDRIEAINDRKIEDFNDLMRATALSSGKLEIDAVRDDGQTYSVTLDPDITGTRRRIGVTPAEGLTIYKGQGSEIPSISPGSAAVEASPALEPGDVVLAADSQPVTSASELNQILSNHRADPLTLSVSRKTSEEDGSSMEEVDVTIPAAPFRTLGMTMEIGKIVAVQDHSPAAKAGLLKDDRLSKVDGQDIGGDIDPLHLPDYFGDRHGQEVVIEVKREAARGQAEIVSVTIVPDDRGGWVEPPTLENSPIAISSIGVAYHLQPAVLTIDQSATPEVNAETPTSEGDTNEETLSPGDVASRKIQPTDEITKLELILPEGAKSDGVKDATISIEIGETNLAFAFWQMQQFPSRKVRLTVQTPGEAQTRTVEIDTPLADDWFLPTTRGIRFFGLSRPRKAETFSQAFTMGWQHTRTSIVDIYLTLRNLVTRQLSVKELHGPLGIVKVASAVADVGLAPFLLFLGFLSINLAVLNFLPIPILDGGHMVFLLWEAVTRSRPSERVVVAASLFGMTFIVALMALVLYLDISRWYQGTM